MKSTLTRRFFVVIHTVGSEFLGLDHVFSQTKIAKDNGADGIFLIPDYAKGREIQASVLDQVAYLKVLKEKFSDFLIGVNFLSNLFHIESEILSTKLDLLQTDGNSLSGIDKEKFPATEFFCGLAFKYSKYQDVKGEELRKQCERLSSICDVPTTSGKATGISADIEKIKEIISYLPTGKRLGLASGVTLENVRFYLGAGVTDFLVATSLISHTDEIYRDILDPKEVLLLANAVHEYNA